MSNKNVVSKIESFEPMILLSASAIEGTDGGEWLTCWDGGHTVNAGGGDDSIHAPTNGNVIDGGEGIDELVIYEGNKDDFKIEYDDHGRTILEGKGLGGNIVRNIIFNVEKILFNDGVMHLQTLKSTVGDIVGEDVYSGNEHQYRDDVQPETDSYHGDDGPVVEDDKGEDDKGEDSFHKLQNHSLFGKLLNLKSIAGNLLGSKLSLLSPLKAKVVSYAGDNHGVEEAYETQGKSLDHGLNLKSIGSNLISSKLSLLSPLKAKVVSYAGDNHGVEEVYETQGKSLDHGLNLKSIGSNLISSKLSLLSPLKATATSHNSGLLGGLFNGLFGKKW